MWGTALLAGERCLRRRLALAVDGDIDALVVEAQQAGVPLRLGDRGLVAPDEIVVHLAADLDRPVRGLPLERAGRLGAGGAEQLGTHVPLRQVVAGREPGLLQEDRMVRLGALLAVHRDLVVAYGRRERDAVARCLRCGRRPGRRWIPA